MHHRSVLLLDLGKCIGDRPQITDSWGKKYNLVQSHFVPPAHKDTWLPVNTYKWLPASLAKGHHKHSKFCTFLTIGQQAVYLRPHALAEWGMWETTLVNFAEG